MQQTSDLRVMVVEDQAILAMELAFVLADAGCDVVGCAVDTQGALEIAGRERPALALVDVNLMDGMTGPLIAQRLVSEYGMAVVFLTANPEQIPEGFAGALGAVSKPFDEPTIHALVSFVQRFMTDAATAGDPPRRLRLAPWLNTPPTDIAPR